MGLYGVHRFQTYNKLESSELNDHHGRSQLCNTKKPLFYERCYTIIPYYAASTVKFVIKDNSWNQTEHIFITAAMEGDRHTFCQHVVWHDNVQFVHAHQHARMHTHIHIYNGALSRICYLFLYFDSLNLW